MQNLISTVKKSILIILSALMMIGSPIYANAEQKNYDDIVSPAYVVIDSNSAYIQISGIKAKCSADLVSRHTAYLKIKMELQKEKSSGYETVETWTDSRTDTVISLTKSRNINVFCDYRLKVTFTADNETTVVYSYPS